MRFRRKHHQTHRAAIAPNRRVQPFRLDRKRSGVVVRLAMNQKDRRLDLVREPEWRHAGVRIRRFPECSTLALEAKRSQRPVVSAALRHAGAEQLGVSQ